MKQPYEFTKLATYNSEVARGLVHTQEWREYMTAEQERFDWQRKQQLIAEGSTDQGNGIWVGPTIKAKRWWRR